MKSISNLLMAAIVTGIAAVSASAQSDKSNIEKVVLDKMGEGKTVEYSIKFDETKDAAIVEVKMGATLLIKSSQQGLPQVKAEGSSNGGQTSSGNNTGGGAMGNIITGTNPAPGAPPDVSQAYANAPKTVVPAKTNWILKKDGKDFVTGADGLEYIWLGGRPISVKNDPDTAMIAEPGTYVIAIKCLQKPTCNDKISLTLTAGALPDPGNMGP